VIEADSARHTGKWWSWDQERSGEGTGHGAEHHADITGRYHTPA
jgi:hypothetical protein